MTLSNAKKKSEKLAKTIVKNGEKIIETLGEALVLAVGSGFKELFIIIKDIFGIFLFSLALLDLIQGTRRMAAASFTIRSILVFNNSSDEEYKDEYFTGKMISMFTYNAYLAYKWFESKLDLSSRPLRYPLRFLIYLVIYRICA